jgi:CRP-like cAMP-binding protein
VRAVVSLTVVNFFRVCATNHDLETPSRVAVDCHEPPSRKPIALIGARTPDGPHGMHSAMSRIALHPQQDLIREQLTRNVVLDALEPDEVVELEALLTIVDCRKGEHLLLQGTQEMEQYFVLEGVMKRVVTNSAGKEMILRFTRDGDMETSYAAWRLGTPAPYSIMAVTKARVAKLPLQHWVAFLNHHPKIKSIFEFEVMRHMSDIMAHIITLHLLDAPGRVQRFQRKLPEFSDVLPKKELASYLNLCAETLSRLSNRGKIHLK